MKRFIAPMALGIISACTMASQNSQLHLGSAAEIRVGQTKQQVLKIMGEPTEQRLATSYQPETWTYNQMQADTNMVQRSIAGGAIAVVAGSITGAGMLPALVGAPASIAVAGHHDDTTTMKIVEVAFAEDRVTSCKMQVSTNKYTGFGGANASTQVRETACQDIGTKTALSQGTAAAQAP